MMLPPFVPPLPPQPLSAAPHALHSRQRLMSHGPKAVQLEPVRAQHSRNGDTERMDQGHDVVPDFMPYGVFCDLIDQLPSATELQLQGALDPLLHLHIFDMVAYAVQRGMKVSVTSNLRVLTEERALECVQSGLHVMNVAIASVRAAASEMPGQRSRLGRALRNLHRLERAKSGLRNALPEIRMVILASRSNLVELPDLVQLAREACIGSVLVRHLPGDFSDTPAHSLLHEDPHKVAHYFGLAHATARRLGIALHTPRLRRSESR